MLLVVLELNRLITANVTFLKGVKNCHRELIDAYAIRALMNNKSNSNSNNSY